MYVCPTVRESYSCHEQITSVVDSPVKKTGFEFIYETSATKYATVRMKNFTNTTTEQEEVQPNADHHHERIEKNERYLSHHYATQKTVMFVAEGILIST